ncbi:MAG: prepilin peptidase [Candidatus Komeilibacteria bacterium]|nr:prepilin peptidase [Candidatus Komeilibacteria bacterium]
MVMFLILFCVGAVFGSVVGSIVYRLRQNSKWWRGRSHCPECKEVLTARELVPIFSWLVNRGKCRHCGQKIGAHYIWLEISGGLLFVLGYYYLVASGDLYSLEYLYFQVTTIFWLGIFYYDLRWQLIPDILVWTGVITAIIFSALLGTSILSLVIGVAVALIWFGGLYILTGGRSQGSGDMTLGIYLGLVLGWKLLLISLWLAYVSGGMTALGLMWSGRFSWRDRLPLGTFLIGAATVTWWYGDYLLTLAMTILY